MAVATKYVKAQGYSSTTAYNFKIEAVDTDDIQNDLRKIHITYSVYAKSPGGYKNYSNPTGKVLLDGTEIRSNTVKNIWPREEWITISSFDYWVTAGDTYTITGRYNVGNNTVDYMPVKGNQDVSVQLEVRANGAILTNIVPDSNFIYNGKITPYFTDPTGTTRYYALVLIGGGVIISWNDPLTGVQNGVEITLSQTVMNKIYQSLDNNNNEFNPAWSLYTYDDDTYTNVVGTSGKIIENFASIPSYSLSWNSHNIEDANAEVQYGGHDLSYYIPSGSLAKLLSKAKLTYSAISSVGTTFGKTITYQVNGVSQSSPFISPNNYNGESYVIKADDGRNHEISYTYSITTINYFYPQVSNIIITRPTPTSTTITVSYSVNYYSGTGMQNLSNATYNFYYRESESDPWVKVNNLSGSGTSGTASFSNISISNIDPSKPFYYKIELTDRIGYQVSPGSYVPRGLPLWNGYVNSNGNNILNINGKETIQGSLEVNDELKVTKSGKTVIIGSQNAAYCHYNTDANSHYFNKPIRVAGDVYAGTNYDRRLAYVDEIPTIPTKNILKISLASNFSITSTGVKQLNLQTVDFKKGNKFSVSNTGRVVIGAGITAVKVSGCVYFSAGTNAGDSLRAGIQYERNGTSTSVSISFARAGTNGTYEVRNLVPVPIEVEEGDEIWIYANNATAGRGTVYGQPNSTYLIVEEI